jgi:prepilin-type processing-associated H-X9-DG protein
MNSLVQTGVNQSRSSRWLITALTGSLSMIGTSNAQPPEAQPEVPFDMPAPAQKPRPARAEEQITRDLSDFVDAFNQGSFLGTSRFIVHGRVGFFGAQEWLENHRSRGLPKLVIHQTLINKINGDEAEVTVRYSLLHGKGEDRAPVGEETLQLRRRSKTTEPRYVFKDGLWGIVVDKPDGALKRNLFSLKKMAYFLQQPSGIIPVIRAEESMRRLKELGLAANQFVQDYDEIYAFDGEYFEQALLPYIGVMADGQKETRTFFVPATSEKYAFNARLSNKNLTQLNEVAQTVMFYEGYTEELEFRYDGKAAVCFTDGHVALIDAEQAKSLRWDP